MLFELIRDCNRPFRRFCPSLQSRPLIGSRDGQHFEIRQPASAKQPLLSASPSHGEPGAPCVCIGEAVCSQLCDGFRADEASRQCW